MGFLFLDALQHVRDHPVQAFPLLGAQLEKLHTEVVTGRPSDLCPVHLDRLLQGWKVYTQRQDCSTLYRGFASNGPASS